MKKRNILNKYVENILKVHQYLLKIIQIILKKKDNDLKKHLRISVLNQKSFLVKHFKDFSKSMEKSEH